MLIFLPLSIVISRLIFIFKSQKALILIFINILIFILVFILIFILILLTKSILIYIII